MAAPTFKFNISHKRFEIGKPLSQCLQVWAHFSFSVYFSPPPPVWLSPQAASKVCAHVPAYHSVMIKAEAERGSSLLTSPFQDLTFPINFLEVLPPVSSTDELRQRNINVLFRNPMVITNGDNKRVSLGKQAGRGETSFFWNCIISFIILYFKQCGYNYLIKILFRYEDLWS